MVDRLPGALLRMERKRQGLMLKQVCQGVCVTSYLSKIEHGDAQPDPAMLGALFARLGVTYTAEEETLAPLRGLLDAWHDQRLYGLDARDTFRRLMAQDVLLTYSPLCADWLIVRALTGEDVFAQLDGLAPCLTPRQRAYRDLAWADSHMNDPASLSMAQEAAAVLGDSLSLLETCVIAMQQGDYAFIHRMESRVAGLALEEGNTFVLAANCQCNGSAYACLNQEGMMLTCYRRALNLLRNTAWTDQRREIYYNIGATLVSLRKYEEGLRYLAMAEDAGSTDLLAIRHKQALAYIRMGRMAEAQPVLRDMKALLDAMTDASEGSRLWYEEAVMECQPGFLEDPAYLALLERLLASLEKEAHFGYIYFYRDVMAEACACQRQYKRALAFEQKISRRVRQEDA
ncbi:MAG: helix-turn-helix domain-containing protein [Aristaeellaceae bacterium]